MFPSLLTIAIILAVFQVGPQIDFGRWCKSCHHRRSLRHTAFHITFDECHKSGENYYAVMLGALDSEIVSPLSSIHDQKQRVTECHRVATIQREIMEPLNGCGIVNQYDRFKLPIIDGAAYDGGSASGLKSLYPNSVHNTCVSHMIARVSSKLVEIQKEVNKLVSNVKIAFEKCTNRVNTWCKISNAKTLIFNHSTIPMGNLASSS